MDKNTKVLKEIYKGAQMGMDAISFISEKAIESSLKDYLHHEYSMYNNIIEQVSSVSDNYDTELKDYSFGNKAMLWYGIQLNTITNSTNSKLAQVLIQGTNMGIIEGRKLLNENSGLNQDVNKVLTDFVDFQEKSVENLKEFL